MSVVAQSRRGNIAVDGTSTTVVLLPTVLLQSHVSQRLATEVVRDFIWCSMKMHHNINQKRERKKRNSIIEYLRNSQRFTRCCWVSYSELSIAFSLPIFSSSYIPFLYFDLFVFVRNTDLSVWDSYHFMSET